MILILDNSSTTGTLRAHLVEELDYFLLPETAWCKLTSWYGLLEQSTVIARKVVEHSILCMYVKHLKVEVYLWEFKLTIHPNFDNLKSRIFSRADTIGYLEAVLRKEFEVEEDAECRIMTHTYELLSNCSQTLQDADLYDGEVKLESFNSLRVLSPFSLLHYDR